MNDTLNQDALDHTVQECGLSRVHTKRIIETYLTAMGDDSSRKNEGEKLTKKAHLTSPQTLIEAIKKVSMSKIYTVLNQLPSEIPLLPSCGLCNAPQTVYGALLWSAPDTNGKCDKIHVGINCGCYVRIFDKPKRETSEISGTVTVKAVIDDMPHVAGEGVKFTLRYLEYENDELKCSTGPLDLVDVLAEARRESVGAVSVPREYADGTLSEVTYLKPQGGGFNINIKEFSNDE